MTDSHGMQKCQIQDSNQQHLPTSLYVLSQHQLHFLGDGAAVHRQSVGIWDKLQQKNTKKSLYIPFI